MILSGFLLQTLASTKFGNTVFNMGGPGYVLSRATLGVLAASLDDEVRRMVRTNSTVAACESPPTNWWCSFGIMCCRLLSDDTLPPLAGNYYPALRAALADSG